MMDDTDHMDDNENVQWHSVTRSVHWGLALFLTFQLFSGLFVSTPDVAYFYAHEVGGLLGTLVVVIAWLWGFANEDYFFWFPWGHEGRAAIASDVRAMFAGDLPRTGRIRGLSSFIHGLGLLAATGMALTGLVIFFVIPGGRGASAASTHYLAFTDFSVMHKALADLLWAYWFGHVGFALLHQYRGHKVLNAIFG
ncbi:MAG: cytochrome b/b6 domain-containing protein [Betaproteobacteria bacterium]|nr:cytochrome b/b6 domain-containing protein [Betaproteobacteria bacterium]